MNNLYLFSILLALTCGTPTLVIAFYAFRKMQKRHLLYLALLYSIFTLQTLMTIIGFYIEINKINSDLFIIPFDIFYTTLSHGLLFMLLLMGHSLFQLRHRLAANSMAGMVVLIFFIRELLSNSIVRRDGQIVFPEGDFVSFLGPLVLFYVLFIGLYRISKKESGIEMRYASGLLIYLAITFPFVLLEEFNIPATISFLPLVYSFLGIMILRLLFVTYIKKSRGTSNQGGSVDEKELQEVFNQWNLSNREVEVILLMAQGLTNKEIAHGLHISLPTVRFHIKNLYGKTGLKSRYEVIHSLKFYNKFPK